jgi:hypothetical protein
MERNHIHTPPEAATDEPASSSIPALSPPEQLISQSLNQTFAQAEPGRPARRCRHDGWTPERQIVFLESLAACGVVTDACREAGLSAQSAYTFRNRRSGRAFATAWDAVLVHRARARLGDELLSRAMNGCIEAVHQNGEIVGERHRFDNRLSMAVLSRLDRLAEKEGAREEQLRAVSEDLDDFLDCVEAGGDADAFVDARRPAPAPAPEPGENKPLMPHDEGALWTGDDGRRWTCFPPPPGFEGLQEAEYDGINWYARTLTEAEDAAVERKLAEMRMEDASERDRYFGFAPEPAPERPNGAAAGAEELANPDPASGARQPSTSSTYRRGPGERHG